MFVIHLPSNVQPSRFPSNSASHYSTQLDKAVDLDGEWEVALIEVTYPKTISMFHNEGIKFIKSSCRAKTKQLTIGGGTADTLCAQLNAVAPSVFSASYSNTGFVLTVLQSVQLPKKLQKIMGFHTRDFSEGTYYGKTVEGDIASEKVMIKITDCDTMETYWKLPNPRENTLEALLVTLNEKSSEYDYVFTLRNERLCLTIKSPSLKLQLDRTLAELLGFQMTHFSTRKVYSAERVPTLYRNIDYVFIYSNICDYGNVGHMTAPLLHVVPFMKDGHGPLVHHPIHIPLYRPVNISKLDRIDLRLCDANGTDIPFIDGKTLCVLHLRRRHNL